MYIWLIAENWPPRVGGIERYLTGIASHLPKGSITVFAPTENADTRKGESYVIRKRFSWKPLWPSWLPLFLSLKKLALTNKPDVIICGKALMEGRVAYLLKKTLGIPYVVCTYGMEISTWSKIKRTRIQLERVLQHASAVLYINEQTKQELLGLGVSETNLFALYPGINTKSFSNTKDTNTVLKKHGVTKPYILSVARLVKRKGVDDLIRAFATYLTQTSPSKGEETAQTPSPYEGEGGDEVRLIIVGDGPEKASLEKTAKDLKANAIFLGHIPEEELHTLYANATLFALTPKELPGDYEGFGIVYLEAALFGLPVVGTKTGGVAGAVIDKETGLLAKPGDIASIKDALQKILRDPPLAKQYGKAGKQRVVQEFNWDKVILKLNDILEHLPA